MSERVPYLHICVTCRAGRVLAEGEPTPGRRLHDAAIALGGAGSAIAVQEVSCLANCARGCSAVISAPGKWGFLLGGLSAGVAADLLAYSAAYAASPTGTVMPSRRPASLATAILGRFPPKELL